MTKLFNDKGFWKTMLRLAAPIAFQNMLISSFTLADTLFVSMLGDIQLSAVGMIGQWGWLLNMMLYGICSGTSVFVAQYWGIKDIDKINKTSGIAVSSALIISGIFTIVSVAAPEFVIGIFNNEPAVISQGRDYLLWVCSSYVAVAVTNVLSAVLRSVENVNLPMYVSIVTTLLNIFLDYSLIFGKFGMPKMEIKGAALATAISAWVGVIAILVVSVIKKNILYAPLKSTFGFKWRHIRRFYRKAFPVIINESLWGFGTFAFNVIFGHTGYENFAALTILRSFENIAFVFFIGICNACCIMVGKSVGKGKIDRGIKDTRRFMIIVPIFALFIATLVFIFRPQLISLFNLSNTISEKTLHTAMILMAIYAFEFTIRQIPYLLIVGVFRSGGDTSTGVILDLLSLWLLSLPATIISVYVLKLPFVVSFAIMYVFEDYVKMILCLRHYKSMKWIKPVTPEGREGLEKYLSLKKVKKVKDES